MVLGVFEGVPLPVPEPVPEGLGVAESLPVELDEAPRVSEGVGDAETVLLSVAGGEAAGAELIRTYMRACSSQAQ